MPRKKKAPKSGAVWRRSAVENTLDHMPKYNGYACGHGAHGDSKYNRAKAKRAWQDELEPRGARNRGLLPFAAANNIGANMRDNGCQAQRERFEKPATQHEQRTIYGTFPN